MMLNSKILGEGPPLIILHGLFGSLDNWFSIANYLAKKFEVHVLDQRNHGKSFQKSLHNYSEMSLDLFNYINYYELFRPNILGHSMGGKTAMHFVLQYPLMVNKLIVVDIAPKKYFNTHSNLASILYAINQSKIRRRKDVETTLIQKGLDNNTIQFLLKSLFWINDKELKFRFNIDSLNLHVDKLMDFDIKHKCWNGLSYFIKGQNSNYILDSDYSIIKSFFSNFELINIPNSGHWVHFDQKNIFLNTINNILNEKL